MNIVLRSGGILLLFFAGITACKKSTDGTGRNADNLRISKIIQPFPNTTARVTEFIYDDQQRVDKIVFATGKYVGDSLVANPNYIFKYYYNGANKNPYKASGVVSDGLYGADIYYNYNNEGKLIMDSAFQPYTSGVVIRNYHYSEQNLTVTRRRYRIQGSDKMEEESWIDSLEIKDHNLTGVIYGTSAPAPQSRAYFELSYDKKINPLSKLNIAAVYIVESYAGFPDKMAPGYCTNNISKFTTGSINSQGERTVHVSSSFSFTYTKEALPKTFTINSGQNVYTYNYNYEEF